MRMHKGDLHPEIELGGGWGDVPYNERQVHGAYRKVPTELCKVCPFLKEVESEAVNVVGEVRRNMHGQIGVCYFGREQEKTHEMKGEPMCDRAVTK